MLKQQKLLATFLLLLLLLPVLTLNSAVAAVTKDVDLDYPRNGVERGQTFNVRIILAGGAVENIDTVQLYFKYDPSILQFNPGKSTVLGEANNGSTRVISVENGVVSILAWQTPKKTNEICNLSFTAIPGIDGAALGPTNFELVASPKGIGSFVNSAESKRIDAMSYGVPIPLTITQPNIADNKQPEPIPPKETLPPNDSNIGEPTSQPTVAPAQPSQPGGNGGSGNGAGNGNVATSVVNVPTAVEVTAKVTAAEAVSTTAAQPTAGSRPTEAQQSTPASSPAETTARPESPLKDENGVNLYVPEGGLPKDRLPNGFKVGEEMVLGVRVPTAYSESRQLRLYYLTPATEGAYYTYKADLKRFNLFDMRLLQKDQQGRNEKQPLTADRNADGPNIGVVIALAVVALACLAVLIYALSKSIIK